MNRALREAESGDVAALVALERLCFGEGAWGAGAAGLPLVTRTPDSVPQAARPAAARRRITLVIG